MRNKKSKLKIKEKQSNFKDKKSIEKRGFHRWACLVILILGGLLMLYGGAQDVLLFFAPELAPVPSWHSVIPVVGLIYGLIVLVSAGLNIFLGWQLRNTEGIQEKKIARLVSSVSFVGMVADCISGYYGFGSLMALLTSIWLI